MTDVLNEVRGGMILDAKMLDTRFITGTRSIMLTFVENSAANQLQERYKGPGVRVLGAFLTSLNLSSDRRWERRRKF